MSDQPPVLTEVVGRTGQILLNRPRAMNALTHEMVGMVREALERWRNDPAVGTVVLSGAGERGLCAGGDIRVLHGDAVTGTDAASAAFWRDEYYLDAAIARYPKPYVAVMDGIVLGGGVGLSAHGSVRIVTERSSIGMPETGIGFLPDVGGTWLLSRAPGELGTHLALTAGSVDAGDAIALGLADHLVPSERLEELHELLALKPHEEVVAALSSPAPTSGLDGERGWIDRCYAHDSVAEILAALRAEGRRNDGARRAAETIETRSPTALVITLRALRAARAMSSLEEALALEYRLALRLLHAPDFAEGVRAAVIDKDRTPAWRPPRVEEVDGSVVDAFFAPLPHELPPIGRTT